MGLRGFVAKRIAYSFILLMLVIGVNFLIFTQMPGNPIDLLMSGFSRENPELRQQHIQELKDLWGVGEPLHLQFLKYARNLLTWNLGLEMGGRRPVIDLVTEKLPYTVLLLGSSAILSIVIGIVLGISIIQRRGGLFDSTNMGTALILNSLPTFWIGLVLLWIFSSWLDWLPGSHAHPLDWALTGWPQAYSTATSYQPSALVSTFSLDIGGLVGLLGGFALHLVLPLTTLTLFSYGGWLLLTRATMLETITEDYILTARAKGLKESTILYKHALRNASLPIVTSAALTFGFLLSGAIITETVFSYPGLGGWIWNAINVRDYGVLMGIFYIISVCVIIANVLADLLYGIIDPRIKYG